MEHIANTMLKIKQQLTSSAETPSEHLMSYTSDNLLLKRYVPELPSGLWRKVVAEKIGPKHVQVSGKKLKPFQFPVGMSNRSYVEFTLLSEDWSLVNFQFPVGMSNRSYRSVRVGSLQFPYATFNSPWECRIGLTLQYQVNRGK